MNNYSYSKRHQKCYLKVPLQDHKTQMSNRGTYSPLLNKEGWWNWQPHRGNHNAHVRKFRIPEMSHCKLTFCTSWYVSEMVKINHKNIQRPRVIKSFFKWSHSTQILTATISLSQVPLTVWLTANKLLTLTICVCCRSTARCRAVCWLTFWISRLALPWKIFKALECYHPSNSPTCKAVP